MPWAKVRPVVDKNVRKLCFQEYPNHSKGCPNYGKKDGCPPQAPLIFQTLDLTAPIYAIWNAYPFGEHVEKMRKKHPDWTHRQLTCCLYWQGTARKQLKQVVKDFWANVQGETSCVVQCPEAQGVNLTATMKSIGIKLEWPPETTAYQIVLAGKPKG